MIDNAKARLIASEWHDGQHSALYALASTGAILLGDPDVAQEIRTLVDTLPPDDAHIRWPAAVNGSRRHRFRLQQLLRYVEAHGARGPQENWIGVWG